MFFLSFFITIWLFILFIFLLFLLDITFFGVFFVIFLNINTVISCSSFFFTSSSFYSTFSFFLLILLFAYLFLLFTLFVLFFFSSSFLFLLFLLFAIFFFVVLSWYDWWSFSFCSVDEVLAKTTSYNETNRFLRNFDYAAHNSNLSVELGVPPAPVSLDITVEWNERTEGGLKYGVLKWRRNLGRGTGWGIEEETEENEVNEG